MVIESRGLIYIADLKLCKSNKFEKLFKDDQRHPSSWTKREGEAVRRSGVEQKYRVQYLEGCRRRFAKRRCSFRDLKNLRLVVKLWHHLLKKLRVVSKRRLHLSVASTPFLCPAATVIFICYFLFFSKCS